MKRIVTLLLASLLLVPAARPSARRVRSRAAPASQEVSALPSFVRRVEPSVVALRVRNAEKRHVLRAARHPPLRQRRDLRSARLRGHRELLCCWTRWRSRRGGATAAPCRRAWSASISTPASAS